ncbi:MAG: glutamate-5-semialdehyde dehydrogenase [Lutibacter sp.]
MNISLTSQQKNVVLLSMSKLIAAEKSALLQANKKDIAQFHDADLAMQERLKVDEAKIKEMILSLEQLIEDVDPVGKELYHFKHENGLKITNKTAPFGTVLIIYESRPDVTVEAAGIAFKSGNKILLKGGKESVNSNLKIVGLWHKALTENNISTNWVEYLNYNRAETQEFLQHPTQKVDLIVPRGGENLIAFVKQYATCPVIVSGRGNNFIYVDAEADAEMAIKVILNAKTTKISACNAADKVLVNANLPNREAFIKKLIGKLKEFNIEILGDATLSTFENVSAFSDESLWFEEFLDYKIVLGSVNSSEEAIQKINKYGGGHSAVIMTKNDEAAQKFMESVDSAAVYQNASTRFTDGGQFGLGGELAISTDKLHHRGPMGLQHLVTNKWYIYGNGQIR